MPLENGPVLGLDRQMRDEDEHEVMPSRKVRR
jgi:hypothetical protein